MFTIEDIKAILPNAKDAHLSVYAPFLNPLLSKYYITTPQRFGAFISQVGVESINFSDVIENASGEEYEGRLDIGNTEKGDGVKFKGRGLIQITGRDTYKACSRKLFGNDCLLQTPELITTPQYALESACWFWTYYKSINEICDNSEDWHRSGPHDYSKIEWISIKVNGGFNGLAERKANYARARKHFNF